jgi:hypothetical protein
MVRDYRRRLLNLTPSKKYLLDLLGAEITAEQFSHDPKFTPDRSFSPVDGLHVCCAETVAAMAAKPAARTLPVPGRELEIVSGARMTAAARGYGAWGMKLKATFLIL